MYRRTLSAICGNACTHDLEPPAQLLDRVHQGFNSWHTSLSRSNRIARPGSGRLDRERDRRRRAALESVERGLDSEQGTLFVTDGAKALSKAIHSVFGEVPVHRYIATKSATCSNTSSSATGRRSKPGPAKEEVLSPASSHGCGARDTAQSSARRVSPIVSPNPHRCPLRVAGRA